jgi:hypothetical protein
MRTVLFCVALALAPLAFAEAPNDWKYDTIHLKKGERYVGLIVDQNAKVVKIRTILRKRGAPTVVYTVNVPRTNIERIVLLNDKERAELQERLDGLKREREVLAEHLRSLDPKGKGKDRAEDMVDMEPADWPPDKKVKAHGYKSEYFHLVADTRPELARLAVIHLEQVYSAYARHLPPRARGTPTTVLLTGSLAEYRQIAKSRGLDLFNPAFYDPGRNQVVCGSDLARLHDELKKVREDHAKLRTGIKEKRAELIKAYRGVKNVPNELLAPLAEAEKQMTAAESKNDAAFARVRQRLFDRLYHESFHAYLGTFVYPAKDGALPHWLNEGLAQIFETAIVEVGELRIGHADRTRLTAVRESIKNKQLLSLTDLLKSQPRQFLVAHAKDQQVSDRYYLASWALAFYLTFDREVLGTKGLDNYVAALHRGTDPLLAFADLIGEPIDKFEEKYLEYLRKLKPDGSSGK